MASSGRFTKICVLEKSVDCELHGIFATVWHLTPRHLHIHDVLGRGVDRSTSRRFVFVSKHFCGDATDIALRFIVSQLPFFSGVGLR